MGLWTLSVGGRVIPYSQYLIEGQKIVNGWLNAAYQLQNTIAEQIIEAESVGFLFQFSYEAPVFLGYQGMPPDDGKQMLKGLMASCLKWQSDRVLAALPKSRRGLDAI